MTPLGSNSKYCLSVKSSIEILYYKSKTHGISQMKGQKVRAGRHRVGL